MTVETLHDALTLLPTDLIAAADKKRSRKPIQIHWQRWAAMAACLVVILGCGLLFRNRFLTGGKSTACAPADTAAQYALIDSAPEEAAEAVEMPAAGAAAADNRDTATATAQAENGLQGSASTAMVPAANYEIRYVNTPDNLYGTAWDIRGPEVTLITSREGLEVYRDEWKNGFLLEDFMTVCQGYDDVWFQAHDLVLIPVYPVPADGSVTVTEVTETEEGLEVCIAVAYPGADTECTAWHILLETEKGLLSSAGAVTLIFE